MFESINEPFAKSKLGMLVVVLDLLSVISILIFIKVIKLRQMEFISQYKQQTITMPDFAIKVKHLPNDMEFNDREPVLTTLLWEHFQTVLVKEDQKRR